MRWILVVWSLLYPGQYVAVEEPAPFIHTQRLLASGAWVERVRRLDDGPDLEQLAELCERCRPKAFFCSSVLQNPTSHQPVSRKAHQLLKLADSTTCGSWTTTPMATSCHGTVWEPSRAWRRWTTSSG